MIGEKKGKTESQSAIEIFKAEERAGETAGARAGAGAG